MNHQIGHFLLFHFNHKNFRFAKIESRKKGKRRRRGKSVNFFWILLLSPHLFGEALAFHLNPCVSLWNALISKNHSCRIGNPLFWLSLFGVCQCVKMTRISPLFYPILFENKVLKFENDFKYQILHIPNCIQIKRILNRRESSEYFNHVRFETIRGLSSLKWLKFFLTLPFLSGSSQSRRVFLLLEFRYEFTK